MDERINKVAALANLQAYNTEATKQYVDGAPHVKHATLRRLYGELVVQVFDSAKRQSKEPRVLDIGAGEGSVTVPFLELGARVVATDLSRSQLAVLQEKCERFGDLLEIRCEDMNDTLKEKADKYDIVVVNSFLHHVPDYLGMIKKIIPMLGQNGQFFSFQDPLRYNSLSKSTLWFSGISYASWRLFKGDVIGGALRKIRRSKGEYLDSSVHDNAEYHVTRGGVDQEAIRNLFNEHGFDCTIYSYFSTQNGFFQRVGEMLRVSNTFAVVAVRKSNNSDLVK